MVIMFFIFHVYGNICGIGGVFYNFLGQGKAGEKALHYFVSEMDIRRYTIRILTEVYNIQDATRVRINPNRWDSL